MTPLGQFFLARWSRLAAREKTGLRIGATAVGAFILWALLLAPALQTLHGADAQRQELEHQLDKMQSLQAAAQVLKVQPKSNPDALVRALERTLKPLGSGVQLHVTGTQLTLTLKQVPAEVLAAWLIESRAQARMQATEVRLSRNPATAVAAWDGTLLYYLPPG